MEKVKTFHDMPSYIDDVVNKWITENNPIITRVISHGSTSTSSYISLTIFYQENIESPVKK
jgi:hypothetical protein